MDHEEQRLAHQTRLAQWALRTLGQAILFSALVGGVVGVFGVMAGAGVLVAIAPAAGLVTFGAVLAGSDAPKPPSYRSPDSSAA